MSSNPTNKYHIYKKLFLIVFCFFYFNSLFSQSKGNRATDSLKVLIKNQTEKNQFHTLIDISNIYAGINLDSSKFYANKAYNLSLKINNDSLKIKALLYLGHTNWERGNYENAIKNFKNSIPLSSKINDSSTIAEAYNGLAIVYSKLGQLNKSIEYNFKTLNIYEKQNDSLGIANSSLNIAWDYRKLKEFEKSLDYNQKSLHIYSNLKDSLHVAMVNNNIAGNLNELGDYKKALEYSFKSKLYFLKLNYERYTAYPISNIAVSYDSLHNYNLAKKYYLKAIELHTTNREPYELAFLNYSLANLNYNLKDYKKAAIIGKKAIDFAKEINAKEYIAESSKILAKTYEKLNRLDISNNYLKLFIKYNDSLLNDEKLKSIAEIETKYETEKKEKEIAVQKEQLLKNELLIKNKNLYAILITSALLILGIISFGYYKRMQFKRMQLQKEIDLKEALSAIKTQNRLQEQRLRISRDLHDNIGSQLTFIISSIDNLKYVSKDISEKLSSKLSEISLFTSDTIFQLRDTIWAMNKNEITFDDIHTRVLSFVEKAKAAAPNTSFTIDNKVEREFSFTSIAGINVFRVLQEAINNAIKYAEATEINILLTTKDEHFCIEVCDNGKGFDIKTVTLGNGLANMEKRMQEIGGTLQINTTKNKGTCIELLLNK